MNFNLTHGLSSLLVLLDFSIESALLYMIVFKTSKSMTKFKVYLALLCLNSLSMSVCIGFVWQPEFLTPPLCVYRSGLLSDLINNSLLAAIVAALIIANMHLLLLSYYFVYGQMNYDTNNRASYCRIASEALFVVLPAVCIIILMCYSSSSISYIQTHTGHNVHEHPDIICYFIGDFQADGLVHYSIAFIAVCGVFFMFLTAFLLGRIRQRLRNPPAYMSDYTLQLHRMFFTNIIVQSLTPLVCVFLPLISLQVFVALGERAAPVLFVNFLSITCLLNSVVSSSLIIYLTKPYREYVLSKFRICKKKLTELTMTR